MPGGLPGGMFKLRFDWYITNCLKPQSASEEARELRSIQLKASYLILIDLEMWKHTVVNVYQNNRVIRGVFLKVRFLANLRKNS